MDPRAVLARIEEGDRLLRRGDLAEARAIYVEVLPHAPAEYQAPIQARIQRVDEVSPPAPAAPQAAPSAQSDQARAEAAANEGRLDEALSIYARIVSNDTNDDLARERLMELLVAKNNAVRGATPKAAAPAASPPTPAPAAPAPAAAARTASSTRMDPVAASFGMDAAVTPAPVAAPAATPAPAARGPGFASLAAEEASPSVQAHDEPVIANTQMLFMGRPAPSRAAPADDDFIDTDDEAVPPAAPAPAPEPAQAAPEPAGPADDFMEVEGDDVSAMSTGEVDLASTQAAAPAPATPPPAAPPPAAAAPAPVAAAPAVAAAPSGPLGADLPAEPVAMLEEMLARVNAHRRAPSPFASL